MSRQSIPLIRPVNPPEPEFVVDQRGVEYLSSLEGPLYVISVVGAMRQGKSFILNLLAGGAGIFQLGHQTASCTQGIDVFVRPHPSGHGHLVFLDVEGQKSPDRNPTYDAALTTVAMLLSSLVVYNCLSVGQSNDVDDLELLSGFMQNLIDRTSEEHGEEEAAGGDRFSPHLMWLLRDFFLEMVDAHGNTCDPDTYLEQVLLAPERGQSRGAREKNRKVNDIKIALPRRTLRTLPRPIVGDNVRALQDSGINAPALVPEFVRAAEDVVKEVTSLAAKKCFNGTIVTGALLVQLAQHLLQSLDSRGVPEVITAWQQVRRCQAQQAMEAALKAYDAEWTAAEFPVDDAVSLHQRAVQRSFQTFAAIAVDGQNLKELGAALEEKVDWWLSSNDQAAKGLCNAKLQHHLQGLIQLQEAGRFAVRGGLAAYDHQVAEALQAFGDSEEARRFAETAGQCVAEWMRATAADRMAICQADMAIDQAATEAEWSAQKQRHAQLEHVASMEAFHKHMLMKTKTMEALGAAHHEEINRLQQEYDAFTRAQRDFTEKRNRELQLMLQEGRRQRAEAVQELMASAQDAHQSQLCGLEVALQQHRLQQKDLQETLTQNLRHLEVQQQEMMLAAEKAAEAQNQGELLHFLGPVVGAVSKVGMNFFPKYAPLLQVVSSATSFLTSPHRSL